MSVAKIVILLIPILLCSSKELLGQLKIENHLLTHPEKKVLYIGVDNQLEITGQFYDHHFKIESTSRSLSISKISQNNFIVSPKGGERAVLHILLQNQIIQTDTFEIKKLVHPKIKFGNGDSLASFSEIISQPYLSIALPDCLIDHDFRINSFELWAYTSLDTFRLRPYPASSNTIDTVHTKSPITLKDTVIISKRSGSDQFITRGNKLTKNQIEAIFNLKNGDILLFDNIKYYGPHFSTMIGQLFIRME